MKTRKRCISLTNKELTSDVQSVSPKLPKLSNAETVDIENVPPNMFKILDNIKVLNKKIPRADVIPKKSLSLKECSPDLEESDSEDDSLLFEIPENRFFSSDFAKRLIHLTHKPKNVIADCFDSEIIYRSKEDSSVGSISIKKHLQKDTCFICLNPGDSDLLTPCYQKKCGYKCHKECIEKMNFRGYTSFHATTNQGFQCPQHHCQKCFAEGLHQRCFRYDDLITCKYCSVNYHPMCVPAGCYVSPENTIICPRHAYASKFPCRPKEHCFECNDMKKKDENLIPCSNCSRSFHAKCHSFYAYRQGNPKGERCSYCIRCNFVVAGEFVYAQFDSYQYHLGIVIKNEDYPVEKNRNNIPCGFYAVQWIESNNSKRCSIVSHYRTLPFTENIWFHMNRSYYPLLKKLQDYDEIYERIQNQQLRIQPAPEGLSSFKYSRNNIIKNIECNRYYNEDIRKSFRSSTKNALSDRLCDCGENEENRCGNNLCYNRIVLIECPKQCEAKPGGCKNRLIANRLNMFKDLEIFYTQYRGYGLKTKVDIPKGTYIGEYCGEVITEEEHERRNKSNHKWRSRDITFYTMALEDYFVDAELYGSIMRYINHSCNPNCVTLKYTSSNSAPHVCLFAAKNISAGEELTFSYASNHHDNVLSFKCFCGSDNCSGIYKA
uniref:Histone-lysine N-methyltransferase n=1 Tax=Panagrolaimus sp. ES5 TaxID=591445 RepID=A0AC34GW60_9BILA